MADYITVNIEQGMPTCDAAVRRLTFELHQARATGCKAMKIIHGYGSSGTGGRLRVELRRYLGDCIRKKLVSSFIEGERFEIFDEKTRSALEKYPFLSRDTDLGRHNNGVTVILF